MNNTNDKQQPSTYKLTLGWLYPELMSTYGDRGNIVVLQKKALINGIDLPVLRLNQESNPNEIDNCDMLFMGGAQDLQQEIVNKDLLSKKGEKIADLVNNGTPGLFICGAYQFLGNYFKDSYGTEIKGLGLFDMYTETPQRKSRLIGNIVIRPKLNDLTGQSSPYFVGFENHGGRTYLRNKNEAFAKVIRGFGNNGEDKTEGIHFKNSIGTYLHGPILPSNPELADYFLKLTIKKKYGVDFDLKSDNYLARKAKGNMLKRLHVAY